MKATLASDKEEVFAHKGLVHLFNSTYVSNFCVFLDGSIYVRFKSGKLSIMSISNNYQKITTANSNVRSVYKMEDEENE